MGYCALADVQAEFKSITFSSTTAVTDTEVNGFIDDSSAVMDSRLALRYQTPVTGAVSLSVLKVICSQMVAERIRKIIAVKTGNKDTDQAAGSAPKPKNTPEDMLQMIVDGTMMLVDANLIQASNGIKSYTYTNNVTPKFQRGTKQW